MSSETYLAGSVAEQFLQTVVVVDDNAYSQEAAASSEAASLGGESVETSVSGIGVQGADSELPIEVDPEGFETEVIVEGFADLGMYCAVLAPGNGERVRDTERLLKLATRADVVILDWVIRTWAESDIEDESSGAASRTTLSLLLGVLRHDSRQGSRVRLVCIYTGKGDTVELRDEIESALSKEFPETKLAVNGMRIDLGGVRVVILRKHREVPIPGAETVLASELPKTVVREFGSFAANGLLPEIALHSLSAVRDQSHKLLRRFSGILDPALISHRSTTAPEVASQFALALIGDELGAIVAAANAVAALEDERIESHVSSCIGERDSVPYWKSRSAPEPKFLKRDDAMSALVSGIDDEQKIRTNGTKLEPSISRSSMLLTGSNSEIREKAYSVDLKFSALSSLSRDRNFDGEQAPRPELRLGALLRSRAMSVRELDDEPLEGSDETPTELGETLFWACLQPLCDSVRIDGPTQFPLLPLKRSKTEDKFDFVVNDGDEYVTLETAGLKLREISLPIFEPDPALQLVLASWENGGWTFTAQDDCKYVWLGDLRIDKAHKVLHSVVTVAGRIGIDEYEFFRNASTRRL